MAWSRLPSPSGSLARCGTPVRLWWVVVIESDYPTQLLVSSTHPISPPCSSLCCPLWGVGGGVLLRPLSLSFSSTFPTIHYRICNSLLLLLHTHTLILAVRNKLTGCELIEMHTVTRATQLLSRVSVEVSISPKTPQMAQGPGTVCLCSSWGEQMKILSVIFCADLVI